MSNSASDHSPSPVPELRGQYPSVWPSTATSAFVQRSSSWNDDHGVCANDAPQLVVSQRWRVLRGIWRLSNKAGGERVWRGTGARYTVRESSQPPGGCPDKYVVQSSLASRFFCEIRKSKSWEGIARHVYTPDGTNQVGMEDGQTKQQLEAKLADAEKKILELQNSVNHWKSLADDATAAHENCDQVIAELEDVGVEDSLATAEYDFGETTQHPEGVKDVQGQFDRVGNEQSLLLLKLMIYFGKTPRINSDLGSPVGLDADSFNAYLEALRMDIDESPTGHIFQGQGTSLEILTQTPPRVSVISTGKEGQDQNLPSDGTAAATFNINTHPSTTANDVEDLHAAGAAVASPNSSMDGNVTDPMTATASTENERLTHPDWTWIRIMDTILASIRSVTSGITCNIINTIRHLFKSLFEGFYRALDDDLTLSGVTDYLETRERRLTNSKSGPTSGRITGLISAIFSSMYWKFTKCFKSTKRRTPLAESRSEIWALGGLGLRLRLDTIGISDSDEETESRKRKGSQGSFGVTRAALDCSGALRKFAGGDKAGQTELVSNLAGAEPDAEQLGSSRRPVLGKFWGWNQWNEDQLRTPVRRSILVRTDLARKGPLGPILMRTILGKKCKSFDPTCGRGWAAENYVRSMKVRSMMCTELDKKMGSQFTMRTEMDGKRKYGTGRNGGFRIGPLTAYAGVLWNDVVKESGKRPRCLAPHGRSFREAALTKHMRPSSSTTTTGEFLGTFWEQYGLLERLFIVKSDGIGCGFPKRFLVSAGFLYIFGHFAGEQLNDGDVDDDDEMGGSGRRWVVRKLYSCFKALVDRFDACPRKALGHPTPVSEVRISERVSLSEFIALRSRRGRFRDRDMLILTLPDRFEGWSSRRRGAAGPPAMVGGAARAKHTWLSTCYGLMQAQGRRNRTVDFSSSGSGAAQSSNEELWCRWHRGEGGGLKGTPLYRAKEQETRELERAPKLIHIFNLFYS
ncbi:hypothetical protein C8R43DRAFT_950557 [Mycena crocata]|nr:hypothetical protein C8R43DRAFT_950557 [Mycena crocata]